MEIVFLEEKHYKIAEKNGISRDELDNRFYEKGERFDELFGEFVDVDSLSFKEIWERWCDVAVVSRQTMYWRVEIKGMSPKDAALKPSHKKRRYWSEEDREVAKENGLYRNGMRIPNDRMRAGWIEEAAIRFPLLRRGERLDPEVRDIVTGKTKVDIEEYLANMQQGGSSV